MDEILKATEGRLLQGERNVVFQGISTDSRSVREGELFIALKGAHFDGHQYALDALGKKAAGVLIEEARAGDFRWNGYRPKAVVAVRDTLRSLGDLARARRRGYRIPVVAVTGSNGKTTTKEMIPACLEISLPVLKNSELCPCNLVPLSFGNVAREPLGGILDRMGRHFVRPRPSCVGRILTKFTDGMPVRPEESESICRTHLPVHHHLPLFYRTRHIAAQRPGTWSWRKPTTAFTGIIKISGCPGQGNP